ncbi:hypothetical protein, partial [Erwinia amylovora]|uniref:hypothetical protein n=1 Tax=Erwinia amylovora TaxID=552 RepID=UPI0020C15669
DILSCGDPPLQERGVLFRVEPVRLRRLVEDFQEHGLHQAVQRLSLMSLLAVQRRSTARLLGVKAIFIPSYVRLRE